MKLLIQFIIGLVFGLGLVIAGMSNPAKVLNFLDFAAIRTGAWDASLVFVLASAIAVTFIGFRLVLKRSQPVFGEKFHLPTATDIDTRVLTGSALFGTGWGLAGLCPGPAFTALASGSLGAITVDGKLVDKPIATRAQSILDEARPRSANQRGTAEHL